MSASIQSIISNGNSGMVVDIECALTNNLPNIVIVGLANRAVDEAKVRIRGAFSESNIALPRRRITINLAPADVPKADSGFDLAIAVAILASSLQIPATFTRKEAFLGELGLDGSTRAIRGVIGKIMLGRKRGVETFYISASNLVQAQLVPHVTLVPIHSLRELLNHCNAVELIAVIETGSGGLFQAKQPSNRTISVQLSEIVGQKMAKRALEIASAGGHNVFLSGPPGTGKSMMAKSLPSIIPPLSREEILEVTHLHSLASHDYEQIITERPFRSPHHSASHIAIIGGGTSLRPGEISLAHRGILFFDELPEFGRATLEALRQPLEDRVINIARVKEIAEYPANFILVATANPCPCGYYGTSTKQCRCLPHQIRRYQHRLSGPILDRIDLFSNVHEVQHNKLLGQSADAASDDAVRTRILKARALQLSRYGPAKLNADMSNADIKSFARLDQSAVVLLNTAATRLNISARAYMRAVKVARTIADLENSKRITEAHLMEALAYRRPVQSD